LDLPARSPGQRRSEAAHCWEAVGEPHIAVGSCEFTLLGGLIDRNDRFVQLRVAGSAAMRLFQPIRRR
jgi:hypothetical protein